MRILQVGWAMSKAGGIENWLTKIQEYIDRERYQMDFLVHTRSKCHFDDKLRSLGAQVIPVAGSIADIRKPFEYARNFRQVLQEFGPYDAIHSHIDIYSGHILRLAYHCDIPIRIVHFHTDTEAFTAHTPKRRSRFYYRLLGHWIRKFSTLRLANSRRSALAAFGEQWEKNGYARVLYQGIIPSSFRDLPQKVSIRGQLGIPENAFVAGHVGRFAEVKNHEFLIDIMAEVRRVRQDAWLLLVGEGPRRNEIERMVDKAGLAGNCVFTGAREDVPCLMRAMDVFVLPSFYEGLSMVMVEAQAAGLPCLYSDSITPEVEIIKPLMHRLPLHKPARVWADQALSIGCNNSTPPQEKCLNIVAGSHFNICNGAEQLMRIYEHACTATLVRK